MGLSTEISPGAPTISDSSDVADCNLSGSLYATTNEYLNSWQVTNWGKKFSWIDRINKNPAELLVNHWKIRAQDKQKWRRLVEAAKDLNAYKSNKEIYIYIYVYTITTLRC